MDDLPLANTVVVQFKRLEGCEDLPLPQYATQGSAAFDLRAAVDAGEDRVLEPGERTLVDIGFAIAIPSGYEMQIRPRSGLALKYGITVLNSPATIDSDYRGPIRVCLVNLGRDRFMFRRGDRIAQAVVAPVARVRILLVDTLDETVRGSGGFGSTGIA